MIRVLSTALVGTAVTVAILRVLYPPTDIQVGQILDTVLANQAIVLTNQDQMIAYQRQAIAQRKAIRRLGAHCIRCACPP